MPKHISDSRLSSVNSDESAIEVEAPCLPLFSIEPGTSSSSPELGEERQGIGEGSNSSLLSSQCSLSQLALTGLAVFHCEAQVKGRKSDVETSFLFPAAAFVSVKSSPSSSE